MNADILEQLRVPFRPDDIDWLPGRTTKDGAKCQAMAYADFRAYMDRLDEVCGANWQVNYQPWGDRLICNLTIDGVTRSSTGEMDANSTKNEIGGTVAEAQAFKRACAMFGLGRYLYNLPSLWVEFNKDAKKFTDKGRAELDQRYYAWYNKWSAKHAASQTQRTDVDTSTGEIIEPDPIDGDVLFEQATRQDAIEQPAYAVVANNLTGKCAELQQWATSWQRKGDPASAAQYGFLTGVIDALTRDGAHNDVLSVLCQSDISSANVCAKVVASQLLDTLQETVRDKETGDQVPNPKYKEEVVACVRNIAHAMQAQRQPSLIAA